MKVLEPSAEEIQKDKEEDEEEERRLREEEAAKENGEAGEKKSSPKKEKVFFPPDHLFRYQVVKVEPEDHEKDEVRGRGRRTV